MHAVTIIEKKRVHVFEKSGEEFTGRKERGKCCNYIIISRIVMGKIFILAHSLKGFSPWSLIRIAVALWKDRI